MTDVERRTIFYLACMFWTGFIIGFVLVSWGSNRPLSQIYEEYNHIQIYEDGSYIGENRRGFTEQGCISGALCED